jgi:hypothetical protein
MSDSLLQILAGLGMAAVAVIIVVGFRRYLARGSERRMLGMLKSLGLDPAIAASGDMDTIMDEVRNRCRHCASEAVCERWLKGEEEGSNAFCPNHRVFEILGKYGGAG